MSRRMLFLVGALLVIVAALLAAPGVPTNCGGNSAALSQVQGIAELARAGTLTSPHRSFCFTAVGSGQRVLLSRLSRSSWLHGTRFLVSKVPISQAGINPHRIIVVCDTPYRNVPGSWFGSAPPTHAAGYADGSYGLISAAEFAALERAAFTPLDGLYPPEPR